MSQKTDTMIKLALVFFVTLLSFSIGTYVGKKYSDNQHKLSLLEPKKETPAAVRTADEFATEPEQAANNQVETVEPAHADAETDIAENQKPAALTDSEVAKIAEEFATEDNNTEDNVVATIDPPKKDVEIINNDKAETNLPKKAEVVAANEKTQPTEIVKPTPTPTMANAVAEKPVETRVPASVKTKKEVVPMLYTVQIGSYPSQAEAQKLTHSLQLKGYKTTYVPAQVNGKIWYRVNVGLFGSIKEAQEYKKEFLAKTKMTSAIVQRVQK